MTKPVKMVGMTDRDRLGRKRCTIRLPTGTRMA